MVWWRTISEDIYFKGRLVRFILLGQLILWLAILVFSWRWWSGAASGSVIVHYTLYYGVDRFAGANFIWWWPLVSLGWLVVNDGLSFSVYKKDKASSYALAAGATTAIALALVGLIFLFLINNR